MILSYKKFKKMYYNDNGGLKGYIKFIGKHYLYIFKKILKIPYHAYMCIKYPFLYPRNRMDGKYHAYILNNLRYKLWDKAIEEINITGKVLSEIPKQITTHISNCSFDALLSEDKQIITFVNNVEYKYFKINKIIWGDKFEIININLIHSITDIPNIIIGVKVKDSSDKNNYGFSYNRINLIKNKFYYNLYKITKWIDEKILDNIFILPTYNEWEAMPYGWNKAFGKQFLKDLKKQLKKDKMLYSWRITTIKEKWGELNLYCNKGSEELYSLLQRYENLSWNYCIKCGKPSTVKSIGWILPYCKECAEKDNVRYEDINNNETF